MITVIKKLMTDESGASAIEYALIAGILGVGIVASLGTLKTAIADKFTTVGTQVTAAGN